MDLLRELTPPPLDETLVARLAKLAARLDGVRAGESEADLEEFNRLAGTSIPFEHFQGIYGAEDHDKWVRRVLYSKRISAAEHVTRDELIEVIRRAMPNGGYFEQHEAYMAIFDANVPLPRASMLIYYPPDIDPHTNTWRARQPIGDYDPTPEQIVDWALRG